MKKSRKGNESEADAMLRNALEVQKLVEENPALELQDELDRASLRLHKRKVVLVVERRGQWIGAMVAVIGLLTMIIGLCVR